MRMSITATTTSKAPICTFSHAWRVGPRHLAAIVVLVTRTPRSPEHYKRLLARYDDLGHLTVEVRRCPDPEVAAARWRPD
jgi:hypothetical protein